MAEVTGISWCDHTFNPWWGCTQVSPACDNCYAMSAARRYGFDVWGRDVGRRRFGDNHWREPLRWHARAASEGVRRRVFCASMADVFEDLRELDAERARLWDLIAATPCLDWLLLTKRPQNIGRLFVGSLANVWLGTTVESPEWMWRIRYLREAPAVVHFLSIEPLVQPIPDLAAQLEHIEWVIAGGESGAHARPQSPDAFRQIRDAAVGRGIPFHFKQWGEHSDSLVRIGVKKSGCLLDGVEWKQFPVLAGGSRL